MCLPASIARVMRSARIWVVAASKNTVSAGFFRAASRSPVERSIPYSRAIAATRSGLRPTRIGSGITRSPFCSATPPSRRIATIERTRCWLSPMRPMMPCRCIATGHSLVLQPFAAGPALRLPRAVTLHDVRSRQVAPPLTAAPLSLETETSRGGPHAMLQVQDIGKVFAGERGRGDLEVLRDVRFDVRAGEFVSIIGPSGCGKTTLLRILHGLEPATRGTVAVAGRVVEKPSPSSAMVFQQFNLFPWLTVAQNVAFGLEVAGIKPAETRERVARFVRLVGLDGFADHYPHELSGGMQQRVGIARALALDPEVLLLDEPFGALDAITREQLQREISEILARATKTVVFITHNMDEAIFFSDRILVMGSRPGRILEEVRVDMPRPREADAVRASRQYATMREHLWSLLSQKADAP